MASTVIFDLGALSVASIVVADVSIAISCVRRRGGEDHMPHPGPSLELSPEWQQWVIDNALEGATFEDLVAAIVEEGADRNVVETEVLGLVTSAGFAAAQKWRRTALRLKKATNLRVAYHRAHGPRQIERRAGVSAQMLHSQYLRFAEPVILTDVIHRWPALTKWTDAYLTDLLGHLDTDVCVGRNAAPDPDINISRFFQTRLFGEVIRDVAAAGATNDIYLVGNNRFFEREGSGQLLADLDDTIAPYLDRRGLTAERMSFWFGPAGTITNLHHDPTSVLYAQVRGRKRFRMVSPSNIPALLNAEGTYAGLSVAAAAEQAGDHAYEVVLEPGELLLLPAGWWHEVTALDPSISIGITNLKGPTSFGWYHPGRLGNEVVTRGTPPQTEEEQADDAADSSDPKATEPGAAGG